MSIATFHVFDDAGESVKANIELDDEPVGRSGDELRVKANIYDVRVSPRDSQKFKPWTGTLELTAGDWQDSVTLVRREQHAKPKTLSVSIQPLSSSASANTTEARISLDGQALPPGTAVVKILPRSYKLRVELAGHEPYEEVIEVTAENTQFIPQLQPILLTLRLSVREPDTQVYFEGELLEGSSPYAVTVPEGRYEIRAFHPHYEAYTKAIELDANKSYRVEMRPLPRYAVTISSEPAGASIIVDGEPAGTTPKRLSLRKGTHSVLLTRENYQPVKWDVEVKRPEDRLFWYLHPISKKQVYSSANEGGTASPKTFRATSRIAFQSR